MAASSTTLSQNLGQVNAQSHTVACAHTTTQQPSRETSLPSYTQTGKQTWLVRTQRNKHRSAVVDSTSPRTSKHSTATFLSEVLGNHRGTSRGGSANETNGFCGSSRTATTTPVLCISRATWTWPTACRWRNGWSSRWDRRDHSTSLLRRLATHIASAVGRRLLEVVKRACKDKP